MPENTRTSAIPDVPGSPRCALSLDGKWRFRTEPDGAWRDIQVPACWESQGSELLHYAGTATYERTCPVPQNFDGQRAILRFDAVEYLAEVWLNGEEIGRHEGGYAPFSFDVTDYVLPGGENVLRVRVTDCGPDQDVELPESEEVLHFADIPHGKQSWYSSVSGIWQSVTLEAQPMFAIERLRVRSDIDAGVARVRVLLSEPAGPGTQVLLRATAPEGAEAVEDTVLPIAAGQTEAETAIVLPNAALWSPETPDLYGLTAVLQAEGSPVDTVTTRFGMRKIETREGHVWLNNAPYFLIGVLDQDFYPKTIYTPPSTDYLRDQFIKAREMGLNLMRCHIKVPTDSYLEMCDELGLLVWYEIPNGQRLSADFRERAKQLFVDMLERDGNHPCVVIKSIINESWGINLGDPEQRQWLAETFAWAKSVVPDQLVVDNSACGGNFHMVSDLDDYHVYYSIPDHAKECADWYRAFADRTFQSYSPHGDGQRAMTEPLILSEFGNWGLPRYEDVVEAEGGVPWWFQTSEGATRPEGVLDRFEAQGLARAYGDMNGLAESSQEQEWLSLKFEIEELRRHGSIGGYVITEFTDINWECNGLLDFGRNRKVFHERLAALQAQDILIPRVSHSAYWPGQTVRIAVDLSKFSERETAGGRLILRAGKAEHCLEVGPTSRAATTPMGAFELVAPTVVRPEKAVLEIALYSAAGEELARTTQNVVFAPIGAQEWGAGRQIWLHDPTNISAGLAERLAASGAEVIAEAREGALGIATCWDETSQAFVEAGGRLLLAAIAPDSLAEGNTLGLTLESRDRNGWWGDWCTSQIWLKPETFRLLPDVHRFDFEYLPVSPRRVLTGAKADQTLAGLFVGWLQNPAALAVRADIGKGHALVTTFDPLTAYRTDPMATLLLAALADAI